MNSSEKVCRFCLNKVKDDSYLKILKESSVLTTLNAFNLKINLDVSKEPVICTDCIETLRYLLTFKKIFVETENRLLPFVNLHVDNKIDLPQIFLEINEEEGVSDKNICRFCLCETPSDFSMDLDSVIEVMLPLKYLLESLFTEINLNVVKSPVVCKKCFGFLKDYSTFTRKCVKVEETILKYIETEGINIDEKIDLRCVQQFMDRQIEKEIIVDVVKHELQETDEFIEDLSAMADIKSEGYIEIEDLALDIKSEDVEFKLITNTPESAIDFACGEMEMISKKENGELNETNHTKQTCLKLASYKCSQYEFDADSEENCSIHLDHSYVKQSSRCKYKTKHNCFLQSDMPQCSSSSMAATHKLDCKNCIGETRHNNLKKHTLTCEGLSKTKNLSDIRLCRYNSTGDKKNTLEQEKITPSVIMYKCRNATCSYKTKYECNLIRHKSVHKKSSKVTAHKCRIKGCGYETKLKYNMTRHKLVHKYLLGVYECESKHCSFETPYKAAMAKHRLSHKYLSQVYKCGIKGCVYKTKYKYSFIKHKLIHKDLSVYKCEAKYCPFETKHIQELAKHRLVHKDLSPVAVRKCENDGYSYETKNKKCLIGRGSVDMIASEVRMYKCGSENCSYETNRKSNLASHELVHKDRSEIIMYKCESESCSFETSRKTNLVRHRLIHKYSSEVECTLENIVTGNVRC